MTDKEFEKRKSKITSGNVKIAKFMRWRLDNSFPDKGRVWRLNNVIELDTTFKFHKSWDHLMPVIEKLMTLEKNGYYYAIHQWFDNYGICGLEDAWEKVVNEIKENYER